MSSPKRPMKFSLLGRPWTIKYNKDPDCEDYGETSGEQYNIMGNPLKGNLKYNLWHEFCHALFHASGHSQKFTEYGEKAEESVVRLLEYAFDDISEFIAQIQNLKDSPK